MTRRLLPLLLLACSACAPSYRVWKPPAGATKKELASIQKAFNEWNAKGGESETISANGDSKIVLEPSWKGGVFGELSWTDYPWRNEEPLTMRLAIGRGNPDWLEQLNRTTLHELGHALRGLRGHLPPGNAMAPCYDGTPHLTEADLAGGYDETIGNCIDEEEPGAEPCEADAGCVE